MVRLTPFRGLVRRLLRHTLPSGRMPCSALTGLVQGARSNERNRDRVGVAGKDAVNMLSKRKSAAENKEVNEDGYEEGLPERRHSAPI